MAGLLFQMGMLAGGGEALHGRDKTAAERQDDQPNRSTTMKGNGDKIESLDRTVLRVGDADVSLTLDDVKAMQAALVDHLKQSDYEDRDALLPWSNGSAWIDPEGQVRIGPWLLGVDGRDIYLRYREPPGKLAGKAHKATLEKKDGHWTVTRLVMERIRVRR